MSIDFNKDTFEDEKDDLANAQLIERFNNVYNDVLQGNGHAMKINSLFDNQAGNLLLDACKHMIYAPILGSIANPVAACTDTFGKYPVVLYLYQGRRFSMCDNVYVILILCNDRLRMFTVETQGSEFMLCEYRDGAHRNYGFVDLQILPQRLLEIVG
mgnify:CR=1 FL=1